MPTRLGVAEDRLAQAVEELDGLGLARGQDGVALRLEVGDLGLEVVAFDVRLQALAGFLPTGQRLFDELRVRQSPQLRQVRRQLHRIDRPGSSA